MKRKRSNWPMILAVLALVFCVAAVTAMSGRTSPAQSASSSVSASSEAASQEAPAQAPESEASKSFHLSVDKVFGGLFIASVVFLVFASATSKDKKKFEAPDQPSRPKKQKKKHR